MNKYFLEKVVRFLAVFQSSIEQLWVFGLVFLCVSEIKNSTLLKGELLEWAQYFVIGLILFCGFLQPFIGNFLDHSPSLLKPSKKIELTGKLARFSLALFGLIILLKLSLNKFVPEVSFAILAQLLIGVTFYTNSIRQSKQRNGYLFTWQRTTIFLFILPAVWIFSFKILWWEPYAEWLVEAPYKAVVFLLLLGLVSASVLPDSPLPKDQAQAPMSKMFTPLDAIAIFIFFVISLRTDSIFRELTTSIYHWSAIVSPAFLVRQGAWLLWDTPSQYGFLNTLLLAFLPTKTVWQSFYWVNSSLLFLTAVFLFSVFRSIRSGFIHTVFSFCCTLCAIFLLVGIPYGSIAGPYPTPAVGPYRFFWCFTLIAILLWLYQSPQNERLQRVILGTGCLCWLLGSLWSFESAIYCSVIWLLPYTLIVFHKVNEFHSPDRKSVRQKIGHFLLLLSLPFGLALIVFLGIAAYYQVRLGHIPDFWAYAEYCLFYANGSGSLPINPKGPVQLLLLVACLVFMASTLYSNRPTNDRVLSLLFGTIGLLWSTSSYYIGRSHDVNITNLSPTIFIAIAVMLFLFAKHPVDRSSSFLIKASFVPILTVMMTVSLGNIPGLALALSSPQIHGEDIDRIVSTMGRSLEKTLVVAQVQPTDPILFLDPNFVNQWSTEKQQEGFSSSQTKAWLPLPPLGVFLSLPEDRVKLYMARFSERTQLSGWLVEPKTELSPEMVSPVNHLYYQRLISWIYAELNQTHTLVKQIENTAWKVSYFKFGKSA